MNDVKALPEPTPADLPADAPAPTTATPAAGFTRALLAVTAAATMIAAAVGGQILAPAGDAVREHTMAVYLFAQASHDIGRDDWAFQGGPSGRVGWVVGGIVLALFWLGVAAWMFAVGRRAGRRAPWLRVLTWAWLAESMAVALTAGSVYLAEHTTSSFGALLLRFADLCSPWWACAAALAALATARPRNEYSKLLSRAALAYAVMLVILLEGPLPGPDWLKVLILAAVAAVPCLIEDRTQGTNSSRTAPDLTPDAAASA